MARLQSCSPVAAMANMANPQPNDSVKFPVSRIFSMML
jgi:hypothetical protein